MFLYILSILFSLYSLLLLVRVFGSWFPAFAGSVVMRFVALYTDPYLNLFKRIIPPIGMVDISPMFALMGLQFLRWILFSLLR